MMRIKKFWFLYMHRIAMNPFFLVLMFSTGMALTSLHKIVSTDSQIYQQWYRVLVWDSTNSCQSFELLFCGVSWLMRLAGVHADYLLFLWSIVCSSMVGFALVLISKTEDFKGLRLMIWMGSFGLLAYFIYLQPSILHQLTRQYVAGAFIILSMATRNKYIAFAAALVAVMVHSTSIIFAVLAVAYQLRCLRVFLLVTLGGMAIGILCGLQQSLQVFFSMLNEVGHALNIFFLKSAFYKWNMYVAGWHHPFGYPPVSFRGSAVVLLFYCLFPVTENRFRHITIIFYASVLLCATAGNDLLFHRFYHYFREFMIVPSFLLVKWFCVSLLSYSRNKFSRVI